MASPAGFGPRFGLERATSWASGRWGRSEELTILWIITCPSRQTNPREPIFRTCELPIQTRLSVRRMAANGVQDLRWCQGVSSCWWPPSQSLKRGRRPLLSRPGGSCPSDRARSCLSIRGRPVRPSKACPSDWVWSLSTRRYSRYTPPREAPSTGRVIVEATIQEDGTVRRVKALQGPKPLHEFALEAVRQWKFARTCLNGMAIPIIRTAVVAFPWK